MLIDPPAWPAHGRLWCHLVSDRSFDELHAFAHRAGVPPRGFEGDHYDVPESRYQEMLAAGAKPVSSRELLRRLRASGLRRPKRRGERVLGSNFPASGADDGRRLDVVLSCLPPPWPARSLTLVVTASSSDGIAVLLRPDAERVLPEARGTRTHGLEISEAVPTVARQWLGAAWRKAAVEAAAQIGYLRTVATDETAAAAGSRANGSLAHADVDLIVHQPVQGNPRPNLVAEGEWLPLRDALDAVPGTRALLIRWALLPMHTRPLALRHDDDGRPGW